MLIFAAQVPTPQQVPTRERLLELIAAMPGGRVGVVADLVADRFITGTPKRISREAPVLILRYQDERLVPGGGANAAANLAALGGRPAVTGIVGDDANGRELLEALSAEGVPVEGVLTRKGFRTPTKTRILGGGEHGIKQQIVRFDVEESLALTEAESAHMASHLAASRSTVTLFSDYGYGAAHPALVPRIREAAGADALLLADSRYRLGEFAGVDAATPNEEEAEALAGGALGEELADAAEAGKALRSRLDLGSLLITRGSRGMELTSEAGTCRIPVHGTDQVADVTGAGDTVIATFALALAVGASPLEATLLSNYAGGIVVMKMGTATLSRAELESAVADDSQPLEALSWA